MHCFISHLIKLICAALFLFGITSCSLMHDDLSNCPSGVWVKLEVTMDVEYGGKYSPQSFADDLDNISLWVFEPNGTYINKYTEKGEILKQNDNTMNLPIEPGIYKMVVWTGTEDVNYEVPEMISGVSTIEDLKVRVARDQNNRQGKKLSPLWHGRIENAEVKKSEYTHLSIELTKNTNTLITVLHDTSGKSLDSDEYTFEIIADNGYMDYDNQLLPDAQISYDAYLIETALVSNNEDTRSDENMLSVARAELNTLRLMADKNTRFVVTNKNTGVKILNINLTEYLLLTREYYKGTNGKTMSAQAYLDYEDLFRIVFFLSPSPSGDAYILTQLNINGWIVRLNDAGL